MSDPITTPEFTVGFYGKLNGFITDMLNNFMSGVSAGLVSGLQPVLLTALTIYFMCKAWSIMYGNGDGSMKQLTMQVIKMAFVATFFCNAPNFYEYCVKGIYSLDSFFIDIMKDSKSINITDKIETAFNAIDAVYYSILNKASKALDYFIWAIEEKLDWTDIVLGAILFLFLGLTTAWLEFCVILATFIAFVLVLTNTLGLAFILAFGPFFGSLALFPQTKELFSGWLKACLNFVFTKVFIAGGCFMMISLCDTLFQTFAGDQIYNLVVAKSQDDWQNQAAALITGQFSNIIVFAIRLVFLSLVYLSFGLFFLKCPSMATSIIGGMQMGAGVAAQLTTPKMSEQTGLKNSLKHIASAPVSAAGIAGQTLGAAGGAIGGAIVRAGRNVGRIIGAIRAGSGPSKGGGGSGHP